MVDQGVYSAECGFVDDASPGKLSDFTSIDCSESIVVSFFNASFNSSIKATEIALIDWIRKSKTNATIVEYVRRDFGLDWRY